MEILSGKWRDFEAWANETKSSYALAGSDLLFRGQANSSWRLETTLDRAGKSNLAVREYYRLITVGIGPTVASLTDLNVPGYDRDVVSRLQEQESFFDGDRLPSGLLYEYMAYLRHHKFPSPLLDWSRSPYVAAFFAFNSEKVKSQNRSIYVYCESPGGTKGGAVGEPTIRPLWPNIKAHVRHFRQQSAYTVCEAYMPQHGWYYASHQDAFDRARPGQDFLWRFDLPDTERIPVLRLLDDFNLNAYSLFDSEESLLETLWYREFDKKDHRIQLGPPGGLTSRGKAQ